MYIQRIRGICANIYAHYLHPWKESQEIFCLFMPQNQNTQMFISGKYVTVTHGKYKVEFPCAAMTHRIIKKSGSLTSHNILIASLNHSLFNF